MQQNYQSRFSKYQQAVIRERIRSMKKFKNHAEQLGVEDMMVIDTDSALELAIAWLHGQYQEIAKGVYENPITGARVRMLDYDLNGHRGKHPAHIHLETKYGQRGPKYHILYRD